jgi:hypothetical protein
MPCRHSRAHAALHRGHACRSVKDGACGTGMRFHGFTVTSVGAAYSRAQTLQPHPWPPIAVTSITAR